MSITIRRETSADVAAIEAVTVAAFREAQHSSGTEQFIVNQLRKAGRLLVSLVAENSDNVVGHIAVSPVSISDGTEGWYGLGPVSVIPEYQRQGTGFLLMEAALAELRDREAAGCVVLGEPHYYGRFGFKAEPRLVLPDVPPEYFQAIVFGGTVPLGTVSYDAAFNAQE